MVFIKDEGSDFDAPIDMVWKYIQSQEHGRAHRSIRDRKTQPLAENTVLASMERNVGGKWVKVVNRLTMLPPLALAFEAIEGPFAGSKFVYLYTPLGRKTGIGVYGEYASPEILAAQLERAVRASLDEGFNEDAPAIRAFASKSQVG
jgi:hypothetical protein